LAFSRAIAIIEINAIVRPLLLKFSSEKLSSLKQLTLLGGGTLCAIVGQDISDYHSKEAYSIKLRYEARASISLGDNVLAILGMGSAAA
jgi:hypothetical protein